MLNLRQIECLLAVSKYESLTGAASYLNVSQPALGQHIKNLEDYLGVRVLKRHSRGVSLTEAGKKLKEHGEEILAAINRAELELRGFSEVPAGRVNIGVTPSLGRVLVPNLLERCLDLFPLVTLNFTQGFTDQLDKFIHAGLVDMAVTHSTIDNVRFETIPIYNETICVIGTAEHFSGLSDPISTRELAKIPLVLDERSQQVRQILDETMRQQNLVIADQIEIQAINLRRELVLQGKRCSIAPLALFDAEIERGEIFARKIAEPAFTRTVHLATPRVEDLSPALAALREMILKLTDHETSLNRFGWTFP